MKSSKFCTQTTLRTKGEMPLMLGRHPGQIYMPLITKTWAVHNIEVLESKSIHYHFAADQSDLRTKSINMCPEDLYRRKQSKG